jgi:hypothetical protein
MNTGKKEGELSKYLLGNSCIIPHSKLILVLEFCGRIGMERLLKQDECRSDHIMETSNMNLPTNIVKAKLSGERYQGN